MRYTFSFVAASLACTAALAQPPSRPAAPIDRAALEQLQLKSEWNAFVPVTGKRDGIVNVQPVDDQQVFVQTRAGLLVALNEKTGKQEWSYRFPANYGASYPIAVNKKYCFAVSVGKLYCFDRYSGSLMLEQDLREAFPHREETPISGPVADSRNVYVSMASGWLVSYVLPANLQALSEQDKDKRKDPKAQSLAKQNVAMEVARDYATRQNSSQAAADEQDYRVRGSDSDRTIASSREQATPSISALYSIVPPYELDRKYPIHSVDILSGSLLPPYKLVPDHLKYSQPTPSVSSQSALHHLDEDSSLRAVGDKFKREWRYVLSQRSISSPILVENPDSPLVSRLWVSTVGTPVVALNKAVGSEEVIGRLPDTPLHSIAGPYAFTPDSLLGFVTLESGVVLAIELTGGVRSPDRSAQPVVYRWRTAVGGRLSHKPIAGADAVFFSGPRNGVVKVDSDTGDVKWRSGPEIDQVLAVNKDRVFARDGRGRLSVFEVNGRPEPRALYLRPAASLDLPEFTYAASNEVNDRVFLAGDNGLLVCLRDRDASYAKPIRVAPSATLAPSKKPAPKQPADMPPMAEPQKN